METPKTFGFGAGLSTTRPAPAPAPVPEPPKVDTQELTMQERFEQLEAIVSYNMQLGLLHSPV